MGDQPKRIQRKRTKGWKKPIGAVNCTRPGRFGNPFPVKVYGLEKAMWLFRWMLENSGRCTANNYPSPVYIKRELAGKDLVCWCPLDQPCHVDVLLEIANQ